MFHTPLFLQVLSSRLPHVLKYYTYTNFVSFYKSLSGGGESGKTYLENQAITIAEKWGLKMWKMSHTK